MTSLQAISATSQTFTYAPSLKVAPVSKAVVYQQRRKAVKTVVVSIVAISVANLLLSIMQANQVYELSALKSEAVEVGVTAQIIGHQIENLESPQNLANKAASLGMVANTTPVFLDISEGKVYGKPTAASGEGATKNVVPNSNLN